MTQRCHAGSTRGMASAIRSRSQDRNADMQFGRDPLSPRDRPANLEDKSMQHPDASAVLHHTAHDLRVRLQRRSSAWHSARRVWQRLLDSTRSLCVRCLDSRRQRTE